MRRILYSIIAFAALAFTSCEKDHKPVIPNGNENEDVEIGRCDVSDISYQILVYSFADSNGDGIGDFKGIEQRLDYLREMGVQALWLSPIHPAMSYHGYDVLDYSAVNSDFGTEDDLKSLISAAHGKGIKIYLDYVLNHTGKEHPWFLDARANPESPYRDYFIFSDNPKEDIKNGKIDMISTEGASGYDSGQWYPAVSGSVEGMKVKFTLTLSGGKPSTIKMEKVSTVSNTGSQTSGVYLWYGTPGKIEQFYTTGGNTLTLSMELSTDWGVLIRTSTTEWGSYKYGATSGNNQLEWGTELKLSNSDAQDILVPGMSTTMYHSHMWTDWFADLNYGKASEAEKSPAFKAVCESADKWIRMGVDGFRLDAIKHIYHNSYSDENPTFLNKFYDRCNATYKACGGKGDIYMVGEHFSGANEVAPYYKGFPGFFDFSFWWTLKDAINNSNGSNFVSTLQGFRNEYAKYRNDYIEATKLSNHDEDRTGNDLGRSVAKMKLAGAVLLTAPGQPYIYQGEELGYWGNKSNGDEYVRTPIMWNADGSGLAEKTLSGKVDRAMLTSTISVEKQSEDNNSILNVYRRFGVLRDSYKALSEGSFDYCSATASQTSVSAWYRSTSDQKLLVVHNFGGGTVNINFTSDKLDKMLASNGTVSVNGKKLVLGGFSSAVFLQ